MTWERVSFVGPNEYRELWSRCCRVWAHEDIGGWNLKNLNRCSFSIGTVVLHRRWVDESMLCQCRSFLFGLTAWLAETASWRSFRRKKSSKTGRHCPRSGQKNLISLGERSCVAVRHSCLSNARSRSPWPCKWFSTGLGMLGITAQV